MLRQGDAADRFFVVMSGWVKLSRHTDAGDEAVMALFTRGDVFAEAAIFSGSVYPYTAEAAEEAKVIEIPAALLERRARQNPDILKRVMAAMSREIRNQQMDKEHIALQNSAQRAGCLLLRLSAGMLGTGGTFAFPYDKALAAAQLGMKPETFSRALAQLKEAEVTCKGAEVRIESFCALSKFCCKNCTAEGECRGSRLRAAQEMAVATQPAPMGKAATA
jgi:CRP-like cAMP-binding protein